MSRSSTLILPIALVWGVCAAAGIGEQKGFDASALPTAISGSREAADAAIVSDMGRRLPPDMSVMPYAHLIIATSGSAEETKQWGRRIADFDAQIRTRNFPHLETGRMLVVLGNDRSKLQELAMILYPTVTARQIPVSGFYHPKDRLILATTTDGEGALLNALMRALVLDDNPDAPRWFLEATATLYESHAESADRLTPTLDARMALIAPDEDLDYDVFAGICDCAALTAEQQALIRLLLVYLDERNQLAKLYAVVREQGPYTTLLQALEAMELDREAWKEFAEERVRNFWKSGRDTS